MDERIPKTVKEKMFLNLDQQPAKKKETKRLENKTFVFEEKDLMTLLLKNKNFL